MNYKKIRLIAACTLLTLAITTVTGCNSSQTSDSESQSSGNVTTATTTGLANVSVSRLDRSEMFTSRDKEIGFEESDSVSVTFSEDKISCNEDFVTINDQTVTITQEGTYVFSGNLKDGQIRVDAADAKIQLVLDNVSITNRSSAAIYIASANKVFITLTDNSQNSFSATEEFIPVGETNVDGVIFSKSDLVLNGNGSLTLSSAKGHGIVSKDDLKITSGTYQITASNHAICGKDSVRIGDGVFTLNADKDAIHSENTDDSEKGFLYIENGSFTCNSTGDCFDASGIMQIENGKFELTSSEAKAFKADMALFISDGNFRTNTKDDSFHSNGDLEVSAGTFEITTEDDAFHSESDLVINDGSICIKECYEGIEGQTITVNNGTIQLTSDDDGFNAAEAYLVINGGIVTVDSGGDGLDSNGILAVNGGEIYISGPTNSGNGALDSGTELTISGGIVVASGASGMAENFGTGSTQCAMLVQFDETTSGTISLKDEDGNELISYENTKSFDSVVISTPEIKTGNTYTVTAGNCSETVDMTETIYGQSRGMGGHGGMGKPDGMKKPDGMEKPDDMEKPDRL